jgi:hypothetical protein
MRLTDNQSLIICAIVVFGFVICGIIGLLDNYVIVGALIVMFILVIVNLLANKHFFDKDEDILDISDSNESPFNQDETL